MNEICYPIMTIINMVIALSFLLGFSSAIMYQYLYAYLKEKKEDHDRKKAIESIVGLLKIVKDHNDLKKRKKK